MLAILALTSHLISGFTPGEIYTLYVDDVAQMEVQVSTVGTITFDTQTGNEFRIGLPPTPIDDEPEVPEDPAPTPPPARFGIVAAPTPTSGPLNVLISIPEGASRETRVDLFDASGRRVGAISTVLAAPGTHRIAYDTRTLESGLYFVRARRGAEERVTRFMVVR